MKTVKMIKPCQCRQGDVFLEPVERVPSFCKPYEGDVVHRGEGGHAHRMGGNFQMLIDARPMVDGERTDPLLQDIYIIVPPPEESPAGELIITEPAILEHEEHDHIQLAPGKYKVTRPQREYDALANLQAMPATRWIND